MGQFDTSFGFEGNDTTDVVFTKQGNVYNFTDPFVHTGAVVSYDFSKEHYANFYIANPKDGGLITGKNPEFGAQMIIVSSWRASAGLLLNKGISEFNQYYDVTLGGTWGNWNLDLEANYNKKEGLNAARAYLAHLVFQPTLNVTYGIRAEWIESLATSWQGDAGVYRQMLIYAGPQFKLTDHLKLKVDYSYEQDVVTEGTTAIKAHGGSISAVYRL